MATELVRGTATSVRYAIDVRGGRDGVSTSHHAIFKVGETTVVFTSGSPPIIGDGDHIVVAGRRRGKVLLAEAYVNRTAMIRGNSGLWQNLLGAAFTLSAGALGLALVLPPFNVEPELMLLGAGLVFIGMGLLLLYRGVVILRAVRLVKEG
jgi:hypothetical protein